ncbi:hypothetical protein CEXT_716851, partial [Caerostris extrusa]
MTPVKRTFSQILSKMKACLFKIVMMITCKKGRHNNFCHENRNRPALKKKSPRVTRSCRRSFGALYFPRSTNIRRSFEYTDCRFFCWIILINFDGQFIMAWILKQGMTPDVIQMEDIPFLHPSLKIRISRFIEFPAHASVKDP